MPPSPLQNLPPHLKTLIANFCDRQGVANVCAAGVADFKQQFQNVVLDINAVKTKFINMLSSMNNTRETTSKQNSIVYSKGFIPGIHAAFHQLSYTIYHAIQRELKTFAEIRQMTSDEQGREFVKQMWEMYDMDSYGLEDFKYASLAEFIDDLYENMDTHTQTDTITADKGTIAAYWRHFKTQYPNAVIRGEGYEKLKLLLQIRGTTVTPNGDDPAAEDRYTIVPATDDPAISAEIVEFLTSIGAQQGGRRRASKVKARASARA